ncbi:MAG: hypothetical protein PWQ96_163 [Clostridia bacterium]|nr:hypothetical protein [Clostridia bacterium]
MKKWGVIGRVSLMKKQRIVILFIAALLVVSWPVATFAAQPVTVLFDDVKLSSDVPPVLAGDRVLVPLRAIFEALGARVEWDQETNTVTAITRIKFLQLSVGKKKASINGEKVELDVPAKIINARTLVPVRFVSQALGASVDWQAESRTVVIKNAPIHYLKADSAESIDLVAARRAVLLASKKNPFPVMDTGVDVSLGYTVFFPEGEADRYYWQEGRLLTYVEAVDGEFTVVWQAQNPYPGEESTSLPADDTFTNYLKAGREIAREFGERPHIEKPLIFFDRHPTVNLTRYGRIQPDGTVEELGAAEGTALIVKVPGEDDKDSTSGRSETVLPEGWVVSYLRNEDSPDGLRRDLYRVTPDGEENSLVVEDVPLNYAWNPAGNSVALSQNVLVYGAGTANPAGTWVKDLASGREILISYPSGVMGPFVEPVWLDDNKLMTSWGTVAPEARAIVVDTVSGETVLELPPGFHPLGSLGDGFLGVLRERENWEVANLSLWEPGTDTLIPILSLENATNFSLDPTGRRVAWLDTGASKRLDGSPYNVQQVKTYHFESDLLQTCPVRGLITSRKIADALRGQLQTYPVWGHEVSWSPDGRYLVVPAGNKLQILEVTSGEVKQLDDFNRYPQGHFTWRPDSKELVWEKEVKDKNGGKRIELWYWQADGGKIGPLFTPQHFLNREPVWSPDGTSLVYAAGEKETTRLYLWDVQTDTNHPLTAEKLEITVTDPRWVRYKP